MVDFEKFTETGARVFAGHAWGAEARRLADLDRHDSDPDTPVVVRLPLDLLTISPSFFRAMFGPSIQVLGRDFYRKYRFEREDTFRLIEDVVNEAVERVVNGPGSLPFDRVPVSATPVSYWS